MATGSEPGFYSETKYMQVETINFFDFIWDTTTVPSHTEKVDHHKDLLFICSFKKLLKVKILFCKMISNNLFLCLTTSSGLVWRFHKLHNTIHIHYSPWLDAGQRGIVYLHLKQMHFPIKIIQANWYQKPERSIVFW